MYRIRRLTGGEVTLASLEELAAAIAAGAVTSESEIHHQRADRWLPIANHPHFKLASDRAGSMPQPSPASAPMPAPTLAQPALRLVRTDMAAAPATTPESRPASRWTPPQRSSAPVPAPAPRPSGSAVPALERHGQVVEFVAQPPMSEVPAPEPVRPKRIEPATAGLPMLDVEMPQPSRPVRAPTPMPSPASWPAMQAKPRPESVAPKAPEPMPVAPVADTVPEPVRVPVISAPVAELVIPESVAVVVASEPSPEPPVAWQIPEMSLDVPLPIDDFSIAPEPLAESELLPELPTLAGFSAHSKSRWPMYVGAVAVAGAIAFFAMRPRASVESLAAKPVATPVAARHSSAPSAIEGQAQRPQVTPDVPPGPSEAATTSDAAPVVRPAPKLSAAVRAGAVDNLDLQMDPTAASRQKALEETRREIESQMQR
ncbi:MAG: hypothetical protein ACJ8B6_10450 [Gemmatimonadales bacterium]